MERNDSCPACEWGGRERRREKEGGGVLLSSNLTGVQQWILTDIVILQLDCACIIMIIQNSNFKTHHNWSLFTMATLSPPHLRLLSLHYLSWDIQCIYSTMCTCCAGGSRVTYGVPNLKLDLFSINVDHPRSKLNTWRQGNRGGGQRSHTHTMT